MTKIADKLRKSLLTPRARRLVELVAAGGQKADSYRQAYNRPELSTPRAGDAAWKILGRPAAKAYLVTMGEKCRTKALLSLNDRLAILAKDAQRPGSTPAHLNARARVIAVYSQISGDQAPERIEHTGANGAPIESIVVSRPESQRERFERMKAARDAARKAEEAAAS